MEQFIERLEKLNEALENIGLYIIDFDVEALLPIDESEVAEAYGEGQISEKDLILKHNALFGAEMHFFVRDVAWSDRVLNPQAHKEKQEFLETAPTEAELLAKRIQEDLDEL